MRVYHFVNSTFAISNISFRRLKISKFDQLNDPFELLAADLINPKHRIAFSKFKKILNLTKGMICFSATWNNPLLWGHYADRHQGIALGFDVPDEFLSPVLYTTQRPQVIFNKLLGKINNGSVVVDRIIRSKYKDWEYEKEHRMFVDLNSHPQEGGLNFVDFASNLVLREVIVGLNCQLPLQQIKKLLSGDLEKVSLKKAGLALRSFKVIEDRSVRLPKS